VNERRVNINCALCERPVTGVHYLWDNLTNSETTVWFHKGDDQEPDQCFLSKSRNEDVLPGKCDNTD
jgi:hypothetical protein